MQKIWQYKEPDVSAAREIANRFSLSEITAAILLNRDITDHEDIEAFLDPSLKRLHSPFLLKDIDKAVDRINRAFKCKEKVLIYSDYDVDGVTSCALFKKVLSALGLDVHTYIPHRLSDGYGIKKDAIDKASSNGIKLIISADCGITAIDEAAYAESIGIDVIITDHHKPKEILPNACAVINPHRADCLYPYKDLAGVGVAYKLLKALCFERDYDVDEHLDLVSLGTIADVVPLTGENRILVKEGLPRIENSKNPGIRALIDVAGISGKAITPQSVSFILGPRINVSGRLDSADIALRLLTSDDEDEVREISLTLDRSNKERQKIEGSTLKEAMAKVDKSVNFAEHNVIVLDNDNWHSGVIGIVASRLAERFYRPTVLISTDEDMGKGSARSIESFHLYDAISQCDELIEEFGGHKYAAGINIKRQNIDMFRDKINAIAREALSPDDLMPKLRIDLDISLKDLSMGVLEELDLLEPFGMGNPRPVFSSANVWVKTNPKRVGKNTLVIWVTDGDVTCEAVGYRMADEFSDDVLSRPFSIAYAPGLKHRHGRTTIQLELKDIRL